MGSGFSAASLKANLKMAVSRLNLQKAKTIGLQKQEELLVRDMLIEDKPTMANIRAEGIIRSEQLVLAYELISLHCELLIQRVAFIAQEQRCPKDLYPAIATVCYAAKRVDVPELDMVMKLFASKFGRDFIIMLLHTDEYVEDMVVKQLNVAPPGKKAVRETLIDIAEKYDIDWDPVEGDQVEPEFGPFVNERLPKDLYMKEEEVKEEIKIETKMEQEGEEDDSDDLAARFNALKKK